MPPIRTVADGHTIKCHLPERALRHMEPVFSRDEATYASDENALGRFRAGEG